MKVEEMNWCDLALQGIRWVENGLALDFTRHEWGTNFTYTVHCRWVVSVRIALDGVGWLTWAGDVKQGEGNYDLFLDFASAGEVRVVCAEMEIEKR